MPDPAHRATGAPAQRFELTFDGRPVPAVRGQSVAAALMAAGHGSWHRTRTLQRPRGVFCGIGVCFDCLVLINGRGPYRACLASAQPGDAITTHDASGHADLR